MHTMVSAGDSQDGGDSNPCYTALLPLDPGRILRDKILSRVRWEKVCILDMGNPRLQAAS